MSQTPVTGSHDFAFYLGVDGGASYTRARLRFSSGRLMGEARSGPANLHVDFDTGLDHVREAIEGCLESCGYGDADRRQIALGLGIAGLGIAGLGIAGLGTAGLGTADIGRTAAQRAGSPAAIGNARIQQEIKSLFDDFGEVNVVNDALTATLGAHGGEDGGLVICGTGSCACLYRDGEVRIFGGRGFMLSDDGSAAVLGRRIMRDALRALDGFMEESALTKSVQAKFHDGPYHDWAAQEAIDAIVRFARNATGRDYGAFAPLAFTLALEGDPHAHALVQESAAGIEELIVRLMDLDAPRISLVGGMAAALLPFLDGAVADALSPALFDACDGAILLSGGRIVEEQA